MRRSAGGRRVAVGLGGCLALQGLAAEQLNALLTKGDLTVKGKLKVAAGAAGAAPGVAFDGDVNLTDFNVLDKLNADEAVDEYANQLGVTPKVLRSVRSPRRTTSLTTASSCRPLVPPSAYSS